MSTVRRGCVVAMTCVVQACGGSSSGGGAASPPPVVPPLPFVLQLHAFSFFVFLAVFPFSRLVHIVTLPLGYLTRPWQKVVRMNREPYVYQPDSDQPMERVG